MSACSVVPNYCIVVKQFLFDVLISVYLVCLLGIDKFNDLLTAHCDITIQYEPTGCTILFQFISIIKLYMF